MGVAARSWFLSTRSNAARGCPLAYSLTRPLAHVDDLWSLLQYCCPWPGCRRSFPELWRLRQHFRAPTTSCGSGKGLGHSTELKICPKCGGKFKPGRHHVKCLGNIAPHLAVRYYAQRGNESSPEVEEEEDPTKVRRARGLPTRPLAHSLT